MAGLDTRFIPLSYLETYFVDKDTGLPLSGGIVTFYKDQARTTKKAIYQITGTPPNYSYIQLPNPCYLNDAGCFVDGSGNDIVPYAWAYDGDPATTTGTVELYYITVYSNDGHGSPAVLQWTREGQPNVGTTAVPEHTLLTNYIPDGQFLTHNYIPNNGLVTSANTVVARGGWRYGRSTGSTAIDKITFPRFGSSIIYPTANPRYACRVRCESANPGDSFKYLLVEFKNVDKFSSDTQQYTLTFAAQSNSGGNAKINITLIKFFGAGGSATTFTNVKNDIEITPSLSTINVSFIFGLNTGKTIGLNDDDLVDIAFSFPPTSTFDVSITDVSLVQGALELNQFPIEAYNQNLSLAIAGEMPVPAYDGSDLYLPLVLTPYGLTYSKADIGKVFSCAYSTPRIGEHECNGDGVDTQAYDAYGIPYKRLHDVIYNSTFNLPEYGTSPDFIWSRLANSLSDHVILSANKALSITSAADGAIPTGFTFGDITTGSNTYNFFAGIDPNGITYVKSNIGGPSNGAPSAGTSGFTLTYIIQGEGSLPLLTPFVSIEVPSIVGLAGTYFAISNDSTDFYVWFKVDGTGIDPAPGGTGILINLLSTFTIDDVQQMIKDTLGGFYQFYFQTVAASSITPGSYFTFYTPNGDLNYVWYTVNSIGTDPAPVGADRGLQVNLNLTDTADDVAFATMYIINNATYAFPDYRGAFPRYWNHGGVAGFDPDFADRAAWYGSLAGDKVGSWQLWRNLNHNHFDGTILNTGGGTLLTAGTLGNSNTLSPSGGNQSCPANIYHMAVIKY